MSPVFVTIIVVIMLLRLGRMVMVLGQASTLEIKRDIIIIITIIMAVPMNGDRVSLTTDIESPSISGVSLIHTVLRKN